MTEDSIYTRNVRFFAICGILAPIIFWFMVIIESLLRPGYSQLFNFVSDLGVGPLAIIQNINFVVFGILSLIFSLGFIKCLPNPKSRSIKAGSWFMILFSIGVLLAGIFPENFMSQNPHNLVSSTAFIAIIAAQLLIWKGLTNDSDKIWGKYRTYTLISGILSLILVILLKVSISYGIYPGLFQRAFLLVPWIWIGVSGVKLYNLKQKE
jgi:hypothetical membrane protein